MTDADSRIQHRKQEVVANYFRFANSEHTSLDAISELLDNSKDAKADTIKIELKKPKTLLKPADKNNIHRINGSPDADDKTKIQLSKDTLFVIDNGSGVKNDDIEMIYNVGTHNATGSPECNKKGSEAVGQYGMGLKNSVARLGFYSMILSRHVVTRAEEQNLATELKRPYIYRLAIWPFNQKRHLEQRLGDVALNIAGIYLEVIWKFDKNSNSAEGFSPSITESSFKNIDKKTIEFLKENGPFDNSLSVKYHLESLIKLFATQIHKNTLEGILNSTTSNKISDSSKVEKLRKEYNDNFGHLMHDRQLSHGSGTVLMVWDLHDKKNIKYDDHDILATNQFKDEECTKSLNNHVSTLYANVSMTMHEYSFQSATRPTVAEFVVIRGHRWT